MSVDERALPVDLLDRLERYYDAAPRRFAGVEEHGPFTLFLGDRGGWVYYARPRLGGAGPFGARDVTAAMARLRELGLPEVLEWVHETTPELLDAVRAEGSLSVEEIPLLCLSLNARPGPAPLPADVGVRLVGAQDTESLAAAHATVHLAFADAGTAIGDAGPTDRDAATKPVPDKVLELLGDGSVRVAVAESTSDGVLATGRAMPVDGVAEIVGVATLPSARRRGLGAAVTAALVEDLRARGVETIFLTASSAEVARVYERVGFVRVGTGFAAERG